MPRPEREQRRISRFPATRPNSPVPLTLLEKRIGPSAELPTTMPLEQGDVPAVHQGGEEG